MDKKYNNLIYYSLSSLQLQQMSGNSKSAELSSCLLLIQLYLPIYHWSLNEYKFPSMTCTLIQKKQESVYSDISLMT